VTYLEKFWIKIKMYKILINYKIINIIYIYIYIYENSAYQ